MSDKTYRIKKYANRRMYNLSDETMQGRSVTLKRIFDLYRKGENVVVLDSKNEDITDNVIVSSILKESLENSEFRRKLLGYVKNI